MKRAAESMISAWNLQTTSSDSPPKVAPISLPGRRESTPRRDPPGRSTMTGTRLPAPQAAPADRGRRGSATYQGVRLGSASELESGKEGRSASRRDDLGDVSLPQAPGKIAWLSGVWRVEGLRLDWSKHQGIVSLAS